MIPLLLVAAGAVAVSTLWDRKKAEAAAGTPPGPLLVPTTGYPPPPGWERPPDYPANDPWPPPPPSPTPPAPGLGMTPEPAPVAVCGVCNGEVAIEANQCGHCGAVFEATLVP